MAAGTIITPGNHDGVHLGHRALVHRARERAAAAGLSASALFFYPNAAAVLAPERAPAVLTGPDRRTRLLEEAGADQVVVQAFDREFSRIAPEAFVRDVLVRRLGCRGLVVGADFRFGKDRSGDVETLHRLGREHGFEVEVLAPVLHDGEVVSSSRIRRTLAAGEVEDAATMLTRYHDVEGEVVHGDHRGRELGFPTANVETSGVLLPADGVYAVVMRRVDVADGERRWGVANVGTRPTFDAGRSFEVHLLDFQGDLYGARVRVGFVGRIRGERRFDGVEALRAQIDDDVRTGRELLRRASASSGAGDAGTNSSGYTWSEARWI